MLYQFLKSDEVKNLIKTDAFGKFSKDFYIEMFIESFLGPDELFFEFLNILKNKNIDFIDALLCAKSKLLGYEVKSFDKDLKKCLEN